MIAAAAAAFAAEGLGHLHNTTDTTVLASSTSTIPGVKDISPRRAASLYPGVGHSFPLDETCQTGTATGTEADAGSFSIETWVAPNNLTSPSQVFLSTVVTETAGTAGTVTGGWELKASQYQEGYKWMCHVEDQYASAPIVLELFGNTTNGTDTIPLTASTLAKDLTLVLTELSANSDHVSFSVYLMGIDPDDTICTFGNSSNRSFVVHVFDVVEEGAPGIGNPGTSRCNQTHGECRNRLNDDTVLNLGQTSGRTIFNVDWNRQLVQDHQVYYMDAAFRVVALKEYMHGEWVPIPSLNNHSFVVSGTDTPRNQFLLESQHYHRWEFGVWNGTHQNIITGPRVVHRPESGTHVTGTAFQTEWSWHHVVLSYDASERTAAMVVDNIDSIDLYFVTSNYLLSFESVHYQAPSSPHHLTVGGGGVVATGAAGATGDTFDTFDTFAWHTAAPALASFFVEDIVVYRGRVLAPGEITRHYYGMLDATFGQDTCRPCGAGEDCQKSLTSDHLVVPSPCATGKYRNQASTLVSCTKCPEGKKP